MPPMTISHDTLNKLLYSFSPVVRDLVLGFTKDKWLHGLDFTTLEKVRATSSLMTLSNVPAM